MARRRRKEAQTIRRAADLLTTGTSPTEVAHVLNSERRYPRRYNLRWGKEPRDARWSGESLRRALALESLAGRYTYGKQSNEQITYAVPPILDQETFDSLQQMLSATSFGPKKHRQVYPLSGRLAAPCGDTYSGMYNNRVDRRYYRCRSAEEAPRCEDLTPPADVVEDQVFWQIVPLLDDPKRVLAITGLDKEGKDVAKDELKRLDAKIANLEEARTARAADALAKAVSADVLAKAVAQIESDREPLYERKEKLLSWRQLERERQGRRKRIKALTRASWRLLKPTLARCAGDGRRRWNGDREGD
jgi:recombinase/recombinase-like zinc beta ribbon protein